MQHERNDCVATLWCVGQKSGVPSAPPKNCNGRTEAPIVNLRRFGLKTGQFAPQVLRYFLFLVT
jgi:hypothetical protein